MTTIGTMSLSTIFFASSHHPPADGHFQGYCFIDNNLIVGPDGAHQYQQATASQIAPALDGCYLIVQHDHDAYTFDVDFSGYMILYYYHDGTSWAVSNSLATIIDHLRDHDIPVSPNYTHLAATAGRGMASSQLFSLQTPVHGIQVVPRTHTLVITPHKAVLQRRPNPAANRGTYEQELSNYLHTWVSRFETLIQNSTTDFTAALTGGVDSRANFALIQAARHRLGHHTTQPHLYCLSSPSNQIDYQVATQVADHYHMRVDNQHRTGPHQLTAEQSYQQFRNLALGVYYPFYIPITGPSMMNINVSGGGGGVHRKIYELHIKSKNHHAFIRRYSKHFRRPEYQTEFIRDGHYFLNTVIQDGEDPLRVLLREGRVRYHTGRDARYGMSLTPLHSVSADRAQLVAGEDRIEEGQFNYDIMHSLLPELLNMPFDRDTKAPTQDHRNRLTSAPLPSDANPGQVWGSTPTTNAHLDPAELIAQYTAAFDQAMNNPFVTNFWHEEVLDTAQDRMNHLSSGQELDNAAHGKAISAVLTADLVTPS